MDRTTARPTSTGTVNLRRSAELPHFNLQSVRPPAVDSLGRRAVQQLRTSARWLIGTRWTAGGTGWMAPNRVYSFPHPEGDEDGEFRTLKVVFADKALLSHFCLENGVTMSNILQIAVLQQYTKMNDACFGTVDSGRDLPIRDVQDIVGSYFQRRSLSSTYF
ncbi:hypothetical protein GX48_07051 [Paracoccidioides brasiliensis]|nr:hypothetical protein GX48_07051 [Paracoccidioides brasiliensis]